MTGFWSGFWPWAQAHYFLATFLAWVLLKGIFGLLKRLIPARRTAPKAKKGSEEEPTFEPEEAVAPEKPRRTFWDRLR